MWTVPTCSVFTALRYCGSLSFKGQELVRMGGTVDGVALRPLYLQKKLTERVRLEAPHFHFCLCGRNRKPNPDFVLVRSAP